MWLLSGHGTLAQHKRMLELIWRASYHDPANVPALTIEPADARQLAPVRDRWPRMAQSIDYRHRLAAVRAPTLICVGRYDPQAPVACSEELVVGIPNARLVVFEHSGHYPFVEEADRSVFEEASEVLPPQTTKVLLSRVVTFSSMKSVITGLFLPSLQFREYTLSEKVNMWRAKAASGASILWDTMIATDLSKQVPELDVPVYFFEGIYDYTCSYTEAKAYFAKLKAPVKGFYTFEQSAHSPIFEEPERARKIMQQDVLLAANSLADTK